MCVLSGHGTAGSLGVMEDSITLDRVTNEVQYNLAKLYEKQNVSKQDIEDQIITINDDCKYYAPEQMSQLITAKCFASFCINCQSITAHWDGLHDLLCSMSADHKKLDTIGLTEVFKIHDNINYDIEGYHPIIYKTRPESGRGGVAMYINENLHFTIRKDLSVFIPHVIETIFVEISVPTIDKRPIIIGIVYRPNSPPHANIDVFSQTFFDVINLLTSDHKQFLIQGDFNIDLLKFESHQKTN